MEYYIVESLYTKSIQLHKYDYHPSSIAHHNLLIQDQQGEFLKLHVHPYQEKEQIRFYLLLFQPIHLLPHLLNRW